MTDTSQAAEGRGWRGQHRGGARFAKFGDFSGPGDPGAEFGFAPPGAHWHWAGGRGPWMGGRRARRGDIRWALLISLLDGPAHGYELISRLETRSGGIWRPSAGSVYPTLQLLEEEGLIKGHDDDGKRVFELTDQGRTAATEASERVGEGIFAAGAFGRRAELFRGMKATVMAVRQVAMAGDDNQVAEATSVLAKAQQSLYRILAGEETGTTEKPTS